MSVAAPLPSRASLPLVVEPDDGDMSTASDPFFSKTPKSPSWTYERPTHFPWFTIAVTVFELIVLFVEFAQNGGVDKSLWANVSRSTLMSLGGASSRPHCFTSLLCEHSADSRAAAKFGPYIERGQWWRFINPMFLHIGFLHFFLSAYPRHAHALSLLHA